jgi:aminoglycoside phosphotransferase (APT) family kinase protein
MLVHTNSVPDIRLRGGEESAVLLHRIRGKNLVVKVAPRLAIEAYVLRLAAKHRVPVPRVHKLLGNKLYLEWISGKEPTEEDANRSFMRQFTGAVRKLHAIPIRGVGNPLHPSTYTPHAWKVFLKRRFDQSLASLQKHQYIRDRTQASLENRWEEKATKGMRTFKPAIVHGDLHLYNARLMPNGRVILLDFNDAFYGDPLFDFAPFKYFCPSLFSKFRKAYSSRSLVGEKDALQWYSLQQAVEAAAFYAGINSPRHVRHALRLAKSS